MKRSNGLVIALVLLAGAGIFITRLLLENFQLKVEAQTAKSKQEAYAKAPPAPAAAQMATAPTGARTIIESARQMMGDELSQERGVERKLWIRVDPRDREASAFANEIATVFRDNSWEASVLENEGMRYKPGLLMLVAAEDEPPSYVATAQRALEAIGQQMTTGRGYQAYYDSKKKDDPSWQGTKFLPEQTYVVLVGRKPPPAEAVAQ